MTPYPRAHVIPVGAGQRSDAEAKRLVDFLLGNDIEVRQLRRDYRFGGRTFQAGSYVVFLDQSLRALANTMLDVGDDISDRVTELYAPPGAWSNGFLWGADVVTIERDRRFTAATRAVEQTDPVAGGVRAGRSDWLALELSSPTAVRTANALIGGGVPARLALEAFETRDGDLAAGSILFAASARDRIRAAGRAAGLWFEPVRGLLPRREAIERVPRVACLCSALENWAIETRLGFASDQYSNASVGAAPADPLADYDVIYNTTQAYPEDTPANATVRARYAAFFAAGGGYVGARVNGTSFVAPRQAAARSSPASRPARRAGAGRPDGRRRTSTHCRRPSAASSPRSRRTSAASSGGTTRDAGRARSPAPTPSATRRSSRIPSGSRKSRTTWSWTGACRRPASSPRATGRTRIPRRAARR